MPRIWLMTDPRLDGVLLRAIQKLPAGSGVIFRHYHLGLSARLALFRQVRRICRRRGHKLLIAGDERLALRCRADGFHARLGRRRSKTPIRSASVHNRRELIEAQRAGADIAFISPVFVTASHPGSRPLGSTAFMALARQCKKQCGDMRVIALGGMTARKATTFDKQLVHGWAAIDAFKL